MVLPQAVLAAIDSAILQNPEEVNDLFDFVLDDAEKERAANKAAKLARLYWSDLELFPGGDL